MVSIRVRSTFHTRTISITCRRSNLLVVFLAGVNAVAVRQCTNWASRFGLSRYAQESIIKYRYGDHPDAHKHATVMDRALASIIGGGLSCWNQPIEVIRVEMQSQVKSAGRPENMTISKAAKWIYQNNGISGFYRGVVPRIGLG